MKYCTKCGAQLSDKVVFCTKCGNYCDIGECGLQQDNIQQKEDALFNKFIIGLKILGTIIIIILLLRFISMSDEDRNAVINIAGETLEDVSQSIKQSTMPNYITPIKNNPPPGYKTNIPLGRALDSYFTEGKWETFSRNNSQVKYTGISSNGDGTFSEAVIVFSITDMDGEQFYYNTESVTINGFALDAIMIYYFWEEIYSVIGNSEGGI